jgi:hypothetical protein
MQQKNRLDQESYVNRSILVLPKTVTGMGRFIVATHLKDALPVAQSEYDL